MTQPAGGVNTAEDICAALAYAADVVSHEDIVLTAPSATEGGSL